MSNPPPDVRKLIDEFAEQLLVLAGGAQLPVEWKRHLAARLAPKLKRRGRPKANSDTREKLADFGSHLRKLSFPTSPIPIDLARFVADAIESYLGSHSPSLDAAFGLTPKRGRPKKLEEHEAIARDMFHMRLANKSWKDICDAMVAKGSKITDERTLRRIEEESFIKLGSEELARRLGWLREDGA
jgi:hypothetical protein